MIDLSQCTTVKSADLKSKKRNSFEISTPETTFLLYADTEKEKDDWIGSVGKSIVRCSSTYYRSATSVSQGDTSNQAASAQQHQQQLYDDDDDLYSDDGNGYFND
jgi:PH domain